MVRAWPRRLSSMARARQGCRSPSEPIVAKRIFFGIREGLMLAWLRVAIFVSPVKAAANDDLGDPVIGCGSGADADAEVDLPFGRGVTVDGGNDLLVLIM